MKILSQNKKAKFQYYLLEKIEAGIVLSGSEVKGIKAGNMSIRESFITINENVVLLKQSNISIPEYASDFDRIESVRERKLLLNKKEITKLKKAIERDGLTIVPIKVYTTEKGLIKVEIALAKGKKLHDKRESIKKKDIEKNENIKNKRY